MKEKLDHLGVSAFAESMGMMIQAGISIDEALTLLKPEEKQSGLLSAAIRQMAEDTQNGVSLAEAMEKTGVFPDYALEMVKAGQSTGKLDDTMFHLSDYYKNEKNMAENIRSAVLYPAGMLVMIIAILVIMLVSVLPAFRDVYANLTGDMLSSSYRYISFSYALCRILLAVMIVLVILLVGGVWLWNHGKRESVERFLRKIPITSSILDTMATLRFTAAFDMFLSSGEMQDEALLKSTAMTGYAPVEEKLKSCAKKMEEGHGFAQSAYEAELYEPIYGRMLLPGERSGNMEGVLRRLVSLLKEKSSELVSTLVNTLEPLLSGFLMISIALVLLSLMLPLIGIMNSIG